MQSPGSYRCEAAVWRVSRRPSSGTGSTAAAADVRTRDRTSPCSGLFRGDCRVEDTSAGVDEDPDVHCEPVEIFGSSTGEIGVVALQPLFERAHEHSRDIRGDHLGLDEVTVEERDQAAVFGGVEFERGEELRAA